MAKRHQRGFASSRRAGWGMGLYRNRRDGWIAGVCAGLADYWSVPKWLVRLVTVALFLFTGSLAFWGYIAGVVLLASRRDPASEDGEVTLDYDEAEQRYRPRKAFHYTGAPTDRLRRAQERLDAALGKIEVMERYVTSRRYDLNQKFSRL